MAVYKSKQPTKDGRQFFFRIKYKDIFNTTRDYTSKKYKNKKDAEVEEARYRLKISNQEITISNITIDQAFQEYILKKEKEIKKQTLIKTYYLYNHLAIIKNEKINDINLNTYKKLIQYLDSLNLTSAYLNKILCLFKNIIAYSSKYYNTSTAILKYVENYKEPAKIKKEMDFYTYEEYNKYRSVIDEPIWQTFFDILYYLGLRCGECQALQFKDIDFKKKTLKITKTLTTKIKGENWTISAPKTKNSIRTLPIPENVLNELKTMQNNAKAYKDYACEWFVFGNTIPFKENRIQIRKNKYCKLAGLKQIRIHDFRHSCASFLINYCHASISLVSKYLGHGDVAMTLNIYTHMYKSELDEITNIINNL